MKLIEIKRTSINFFIVRDLLGCALLLIDLRLGGPALRRLRNGWAPFPNLRTGCPARRRLRGVNKLLGPLPGALPRPSGRRRWHQILPSCVGASARGVGSPTRREIDAEVNDKERVTAVFEEPKAWLQIIAHLNFESALLADAIDCTQEKIKTILGEDKDITDCQVKPPSA